MKCIKCGRPVGASRYCNACGFDNKHIAKALNTADYYYNIGLEKAQMHDLSGAEIYLKKALNYNKSHKNARNLLGLVYNEMGEGGKAYIQWKISAKLSSVEENVANLYIRQMEETSSILQAIRQRFQQAKEGPLPPGTDWETVFRFQEYTLEYGIAAAQFQRDWYRQLLCKWEETL